MKIVLDARAALHFQSGGFKTYARGLIKGLSYTDKDFGCLLLVDRPVSEDWWPADARFETRILPSGLPLLGAGLREQFVLPCLLGQEDYDVVHFLCNTGPFLMPRASLVTIHDLAPLIYPPEWPRTLSLSRWRRFLIRSYAQLLLPHSAQRAMAIITDSEASKIDLVRCLRVSPEKVRVIPLGYDQVFSPCAAVHGSSLVAQWKLESGRFVLVLGSLSKRKNVAAVMEAFAKLPKRLKDSYPLVVIVTDRSDQASLTQLAARLDCHEVRFVPGPESIEELAGWYSTARVFVMCSLYEGFGLPALEAMACGTPVVSSNISSLPEVVGDAACLVNPCDPLMIRDAIQAVLENEALYSDLKAHSLKRAALFSWERTAIETLAVYEQVCRHSCGLCTFWDS